MGHYLRLTEIIKEIGIRKKTGELSKKRVACAHCGCTWIEVVGLIVGQKEGSEDLCLRIGMESESCQTCRQRPLECPQCGSKDVYEIMLSKDISEGGALSFRGIKKVTKSSDVKIS